MSPSPSPRKVTIDLEKFHEDGLRHLAGLIPHQSPEALLKIVISRGLVAMLESEFERYQRQPEEIAENAAKQRMGEFQSREPSLAARAEVRPFPSPSVLYKRKHRKQIEQAEADVGLAMAPEQPADASQRPVPRRHVERSLAGPIPEDLRQRFENWLDAHPDLDKEEALTTVLQRGLDRIEQLEEGGQGPREKQAANLLRLAERLYARWKMRCGA